MHATFWSDTDEPIWRDRPLTPHGIPAELQCWVIGLRVLDRGEQILCAPLPDGCMYYSHDTLVDCALCVIGLSVRRQRLHNSADHRIEQHTVDGSGEGTRAKT